MAKAAKEKRVPSYGEAYLCVVLVFGIVIGAMILGIPVQATMLFAAIIAAAMQPLPQPLFFCRKPKLHPVLPIKDSAALAVGVHDRLNDR